MMQSVQSTLYSIYAIYAGLCKACKVLLFTVFFYCRFLKFAFTHPSVIKYSVHVNVQAKHFFVQ